jgi:hypothetical protein
MGIIIIMGAKSIKESIIKMIKWVKYKGYINMFSKTKKYLNNETIEYESSPRNNEFVFEKVPNIENVSPLTLKASNTHLIR